MRLLLTNDDGIHAEGVSVLYRTLSRIHTVTLVAPDRERSAVGHGITLERPLRAVKVSLTGGITGYAVSGTPADCVKLGIREILEDRPDLVVSGINPGANVGININYSGTVAAAREAALNGIPAVAVSMQGCSRQRHREASAFVEKLAVRLLRHPMPFGTFLNVNLPDVPLKHIAGIRVSRLSVLPLCEYFEKRQDPRDRPYFWQGRDRQSFSDNPDMDGDALNQRFISLTPITCDTTDYRALETLKQLDFSIESFR